jgi:sugar/nucleoside kinase (ribokinase family)
MKRTASPTVDAVVAGYFCVDLAPGFPSHRQGEIAGGLFRPGRLIETHGLSVSLGGVVANTGLAMKKFGRRVELMGCIGKDALGDIAAGLLLERDVAHGLRRTPRAGTAYGIVLAPQGMNRIFLEDPGCNGLFTADDIDYDIVRRSRLFHFGYPTLMRRLWVDGGTKLKQMLARVGRLGVATSMDLSLPDSDSPAGKADWRSILARVLPHVNIFVPSIEEILFMLEPHLYGRLVRRLRGRDLVDLVPPEVVERLADRILAAGVKVLLIKLGHRGAYVRTGDVSTLSSSLAVAIPVANWSHRSLWVAPYPVNRRRVQNASGAGDCAVAGFLTALISGAAIERAGQYAMLAGRDNLYGVDAFSGLRDWKTMTTFLDRGSRQQQQKVS